MSLLSSINQPDETPLHSSGIGAAGTGGAPQSFTERKKLERERKLVQGYRFSLVGGRYAERGNIRPPQRSAPTDTQPDTRQAFNTTGASASVTKLVVVPTTSGSSMTTPSPAATAGPRFVEPQSRGYNPYG